MLLSLKDLPTSLPASSIDTGGSKPLNTVPQTVCFVSVINKDGKEGSGSGVVITQDGKILTSYHVIEDAESITACFKWYSAPYFDGDEKEADFSILQIEGKDFLSALIAEYKDDISIGEDVGLLGYPLGEDLGKSVTYTTGVISSIREDENGITLFQIDANGYHGSSGGPLFRQCDVRVIGILRGDWKEGVMINFIVSIKECYKRLIQEGV